jgi:hypothetical protein
MVRRARVVSGIIVIVVSTIVVVDVVVDVGGCWWMLLLLVSRATPGVQPGVQRVVLQVVSVSC